MNNERIAEQSTKSLNEGSLTYEHCNNEALRLKRSDSGKDCEHSRGAALETKWRMHEVHRLARGDTCPALL